MMQPFPKDLIEILGVAPFYHLVPRQDLAPLSSINSISPSAIDPKDHISSASAQLADLSEKSFDDLSPEEKDPVLAFATKFKAFQVPELENISFKRPVIAAHSGKTPHLSKLPSIYDHFKSEEDMVSPSDIQESVPNLDVSRFEGDTLELLEDISDVPKVKSHIQDYKKRLDAAMASSTRKRPARFEASGMTSKKKLAHDPAISSAIREQAFGDILDALDLESSDQQDLVRYSKHLTVREGQVSLSRFALTEIRKIYSQNATDSEFFTPAQRLKIQRLCVKTISTTSNASSEDLSDSLQASTALLQILNSNIKDRQLHLYSFVDAVIHFLKTITDRLKHGEISLNLQKEIFECFDAFSVQVKHRAIDEHHVTKLEYLCVGTLAAKARTETFDSIKPVCLDFLVCIFKYYPSQREFITNELLFNLKEISSQNQGKQTRFSSKISVSFTSVLFLRLIQSFDLQELQNDASTFLEFAGQPAHKNVTHQQRKKLSEVIQMKYSGVIKILEQIAAFIHDSLSILNQDSKQILTGLIKDLVVLAPLPEWPGAESMLVTILSKLTSEMISRNIPQNQEPFVLDLVGEFGVSFLNQKVADGSVPSTETAGPNFHAFHKDVLLFLKSSKSVSLQDNTEFQHQLMKCLNYFSGLLISADTIKNDHHGISKDTESSTEPFDEYLTVLSYGSISNPSSLGSELGRTAHISYNHILMSGVYSQLYDKFVSLLKISLDSPRAKVTAKAIRVLSRLIEVEPQTLLKMKISQSVSKLLKGKSALSRDAVIDLLGDYMFTSPELTRTYYKSVGDMSDDDSISVRKRVAKIMQEAYLKVDDVYIKSYVLEKLLRRLDDQEVPFANATRSSLSSLIFLDSAQEMNTQVLVEVLKQGNQVRNSLSKFFKHALESDDSKNYRHAASKSILSNSVDKALLSESTKVSTGALQLVNLLVQCDKSLITQDQLISLQPFFLDDSTETKCYHALKITRLALIDFRMIRPQYLSSTLQILFQRLTKLGIRELHEAVQVIVLLTTGSDNLGLVKAAISSMKLLWPQVSRFESTENLEFTKTCKLLQLLGCFGSYCNFNNNIEVFMRSDIGLKPNETVISLITRYLIFYCQPMFQAKVRVCAEKSLISVASHNPQIFLSNTVLDTLDNELRSGPDSTKFAIVSGLTKYLAKESEDLERSVKDGIYNAERFKNRFLGIENSSVSDSVCAGIVQRYTPSILELCLLDSGDSGELCVHYVQLVMKLGYANPKVCVPTILALQASFNSRIKNAATELFEDVFNKYESLADRNYVEAVTLAAKYVQRTGDLRGMDVFLNSVYRTIRRTYSARKKFTLSLAKLFRVDVSKRSLSEAVEQRDRTVFLALNLSKIRFDSSEEVFLLVYHLDRSITKEGLDISEKITSTVGSKSGDGMSLANLQLLFVYSQTLLGLIYLRQFLASAYGVGAAAMDTFRPSRADPELRQEPKMVYIIEFPVESLQLDIKLNEPSSFGPLFTRMVQSAREYTT